MSVTLTESCDPCGAEITITSDAKTVIAVSQMFADLHREHWRKEGGES